MSAMMFLDETEICERAVRRLARSRNADVSRSNGSWMFNGVELDSDEMWDVLSTMPVVSSVRYGLL
jgi:hypothetical protein